ncbi:hypothetical protein [Tabrizicola sp. M-4]|uniref:hypothetical protein n=1 Tax=Tabrizicola sp. M-4 TaxID=3055847 RepID=UPI003DA989DD
MAYMAILTMGGFGLVIAMVSHFTMKRERQAIIAARALLAEGESSETAVEAKAASGKASVAGLALSRGASAATLRQARSAAKQYRRVQVK